MSGREQEGFAQRDATISMSLLLVSQRRTGAFFTLWGHHLAVLTAREATFVFLRVQKQISVAFG